MQAKAIPSVLAVAVCTVCLSPCPVAGGTYVIELPEMLGEYVRKPFELEFVTHDTSLEFLQQMFLTIDEVSIHVAGTSSGCGMSLHEDTEMLFYMFAPGESFPLTKAQVPCEATFDGQESFELIEALSFDELLSGEPCTLTGQVYVAGVWPQIWPPAEPPACANVTVAELIVTGEIPEPGALALLCAAGAFLLRRRRLIT